MSKYTTALGNKICEATATSSIGLRHICKQLRLPYSTVTDWIYNPQHELYNKYTRAKQMQLHHLAEEILEIADDSTNDYMEVIRNGKKKIIQNREAISRSRLRIQARMNILTKLAPLSQRKVFAENDLTEPDLSQAFRPKPITKEQQARMNDRMAQDSMSCSGSVIPDHMVGDLQSPKQHEPAAKKQQKKTPASSPENDPKPAPAEQHLITYTRYGWIEKDGTKYVYPWIR